MEDEKQRIPELLEEILTWTKLANFARVRTAIEDLLDDEKKIAAYELTGALNRNEICNKLKMGSHSLAALWQKCERIGLLIKKGKGYEKVVNLTDFGIEVPEK